MLVISRKKSECVELSVGGVVLAEVVIVECGKNAVRLGIHAKDSVRIMRTAERAGGEQQ
jgi:sRNA-binding carbon storage regulator CsrA